MFISSTMTPSTGGTAMPFIQDVNMILIGAIFSGIILLLCVVLYCCHKNAPEQVPNLIPEPPQVPRPYWRDSLSPIPACSHARDQELAQPTIEADLPSRSELIYSSNRNTTRCALCGTRLLIEYETQV